MLSQSQIADAAARLHKAEKTRVQIRQLSQDNPDMTMDDAYAIQAAWTAMKLAEGRIAKGHKIGLTSKAMQDAVGIKEPDHGTLFDDMFFNDGGTVPTSRFIGLRVEAELAFVLNRKLEGPDCTVFDVLNATDFVTPALEILDTRIERVDAQTKSTRKVVDTISDNAANAGIVLGGRPFRPLDFDMRWIAAICSKNAVIEETGVAAGVLNNPANGIVWLVKKLSAHGVALLPGDVVLSGSFIRPVEVGKGDTIQADYGPLGTVSCYFG